MSWSALSASCCAEGSEAEQDAWLARIDRSVPFRM
jgi:hypothetical protein